jgi:hypothetical protein
MSRVWRIPLSFSSKIYCTKLVIVKNIAELNIRETKVVMKNGNPETQATFLHLDTAPRQTKQKTQHKKLKQ